MFGSCSTSYDFEGGTSKMGSSEVSGSSVYDEPTYYEFISHFHIHRILDGEAIAKGIFNQKFEIC
jgi:hypothetical protein